MENLFCSRCQSDLTPKGTLLAWATNKAREISLSTPAGDLSEFAINDDFETKSLMIAHWLTRGEKSYALGTRIPWFTIRDRFIKNGIFNEADFEPFFMGVCTQLGSAVRDHEHERGNCIFLTSLLTKEEC